MKFSQYDEKICCKSVIKNIFDLNELDFEVYKQLKGKKESKVENVAKNLKKERSVIYRSLQRLTACKLCIKQRKKIKTGGYYHVYFCNDLKSIKKELEDCIDNWYFSIKQILNKIEKEL
jgi:predicted transcriptional regulator